MIVRELYAKLGLQVDKTSFATGDAFLSATKRGLLALASLAGVAAAGLASAVHGLIETTSALNDTSQAAGVSTDALQELGYAAKLNGASSEEMIVGLKKLSIHMQSASEGSQEAADTFAHLGVKIRDSGGQLRPADEVLGDIADKFQKMPDGARKVAYAVDAFGKSGSRLIPMLNGGRGELEKMRAEARDLGIVLSSETIKAGDELGDSIDRIKAAATGAQYTIGGPLLKGLNDAAVAALDWYKANRKLVLSRLEVFARLGVATIKALVVVMKALAVVMNYLLLVIGKLLDNWKLLAVMLSSVVLTAISMNSAAILNLIKSYILLGQASVGAALRVAGAWALAAIGPLTVAAAIASILIVLEDLYVWATKGAQYSFFGKFGIEIEKMIDQWLKGFEKEWPFIKHLRTALDLIRQIREEIVSLIAAGQAKPGGLISQVQSKVQSIKENPSQLAPSFSWRNIPMVSVPLALGKQLASGIQNITVSPVINQTVVQTPGQSGKDFVTETNRTIGDALGWQIQDAVPAQVR